MREFDIYQPKHRVMLHLLANQRRQGNPAVYSNWMDETLNRVLATVGRAVHSVRFEQDVLSRMSSMGKPVRRRTK